MPNTHIEKCACCEARILYIHGDCIWSDSVPSKMIPVADLSLSDLVILLNQISQHLPQAN